MVRIYLDALEWEYLHESYALEQCLDKTYGERLVGAIIANEPICKKMRLGGYLTRIVDAVRREGEVGEEGEDNSLMQFIQGE